MCRFRPRAPAQPFHVSTALPPWIASRRFFARRRYPRFPSHSLAVVRGYSEDAYLRARPRPRNLGTRLEWIRITLFWARRRLPTSATTNDAQAHHTSVPPSSVNSRNRGSCEHSLPRETLHVVHLRRLATPFWLLPSSRLRTEARSGYPEGQRATLPLFAPSFPDVYWAGCVGRERPSKGLACYGERPSSNIPRAPGSPIPSFREVRSLLSSW